MKYFKYFVYLRMFAMYFFSEVPSSLVKLVDDRTMEIH